MARVSTDDDELRKRGYAVGGVLGEGSYAKVSTDVLLRWPPMAVE